MFVAVFYFIFSLLHFSTALPTNFLCKTRKKYGESIFLTIRRTERLTIKYQKSKCDVEFLRLCLIYNLIPKFIRLKFWKPELKTHGLYQQYQRHCILTEYKTHNKDSLKLKKEIESLMNTLKRKLQLTDYKHLEQFLYERANHINEETTKKHEEKLRTLKRGSIGQDYRTMKDKILHNISSYQLTQAGEGILCRGISFCIENKLTDYLDFQTDVEYNRCKVEEHCHPTIFRSLCQNMYRYSKQLIISNKKKIMRNISDEELDAIRNLKNNDNIIITKADKGNAIVILDKKRLH